MSAHGRITGRLAARVALLAVVAVAAAFVVLLVTGGNHQPRTRATRSS